jgi:hypothetical protein
MMLFDHLIWIVKEAEFNINYYMLGLNRKGVKISDFMGRRSFSEYKLKVEKLLTKLSYQEYLSPKIITKDKFYCESILKANGFAVLESLFLLCRNELFPLKSATQNFNKLNDLEDGAYVIKNVIKESGEGVIDFSIKDGMIYIQGIAYDNNLLNELSKRNVMIIQQRYQSHDVLSVINNSALNTTRIFTIQGGSGIEYLGGFQAFATDDAVVDSWKFGSVYVGIDPEKGVLKKYGITSLTDNRSGIILQHPNSNILFDGYIIPYLKEAIELCKKAHKLFYGNFIIGWDIAITKEGPMIVEANELPGINVLQCLNGGIRFKIKEKYSEIMKMFNE